MNDTQTQIERLIELAIVQRSELKQLVSELPQLREHLNAEIERTFEEAEPQIRTELEEFCRARATDEHAKTGAALAAKVEQLSKQLEVTTAAKYSVLMAERAENANLLAKAEARIEDAASMLTHAVKEIVTDELSRFPRAGEIDQLRKEFAEPRGLNPRGRWMPDETYQRLDLVTINGDSFVSNIDGNRERPSRTAGDWTLSAARGNGGGGGVTSLTDLVPVPSNGQLLIGNGSAFVNSALTAGTGISISNGAGSITINATDGNITLDDGTAAAPSLNFTNYPTTGLYSSAANAIGFATSGVARAAISSTGFSVTGALSVSGVATLGAGAILNTPASGVATNLTGLPISTGVSGLGTGIATFLATPSSANLAAALTDETGTGALVFATSPTLTTPISATLTSPASTALTLAGGSGNTNVILTPSGSGNVGIGTTTPAKKLDVNGDVNISSTTAGSSGAGALVVAGGLSAAGPSYFGGAVTVSTSGAGQLTATTSGTDRAEVIISKSTGTAQTWALSTAGSANGYGSADRSFNITNTTNGVVPFSISAGSLGSTTVNFYNTGATTFAGAVTVGTGAAVGGATAGAGGLAFPATAVAVANANTLDDYEEGTFTPIVSDAASGGNLATLSDAEGVYTKIGNIVYWRFNVVLTSKASASAGNTVFIQGLPFQSATIPNGWYNPNPTIIRNITFAGYVQFNVSGANSYGFFRENVSNAAGDDIIFSDLTNSAAMQVSGFYKVI